MAARARHWLWVVVGTVGIGMGAVQIAWAARDSTRKPVDVAVLESGGSPGGRYIEVRGGRVLPGFEARKRVGLDWEHWVMYGTSRDRARVLLRVDAKRWPLPAGQETFDGMYGVDFVPTELIEPLVQAGRHTEQFEVLAVGATPGSTRYQGLGFLGIGLGMILWHGWRLGWFSKPAGMPGSSTS